jgi:HEAT repeat protein
MYLVDVTSGQLGDLITYLETVARDLEVPPELSSIFPKNFQFDFSRIRVSVQLSEERLHYEEARANEMERAVGLLSEDQIARIYARRSVEEFEEQSKRRPEKLKRPIVRYWEAVRGNLHSPNQKRAVILGDPGFGKSWLLRHEGIKLALAELERLGKGDVGTLNVNIPIFVRLSSLSFHEGNLISRIKSVLSAQAHNPELLDKLWPLIERKVKNGQALLLLDGWDEVQADRESLKEALEALVRNQPECRVYLTSRIAGYEPISLDAHEWEMVSFAPQQIDEFVRTFFESIPKLTADYEPTQKATKLVESLKQNYQIMGLARIPLMLALLCRLYWENEQLPVRRCEVYDACLWGLVFKWKRSVKGNNENEETRKTLAELKLKFLSDLALRLFLSSASVDAWARLTLCGTAREIDRSEQMDHEVARRIGELVLDGVLVQEGEGDRSPLRFIHRTFQEYLAAVALVNRVNASNELKWATKINGEDCQVTIDHLINKKCWDPNWQEVIILLAGQLDDPTYLLHMLHCPKNDDIQRHRLGLAVICLTELKQVRRGQFTDQIAQEFFDLWWSGKVVRNLNRYLPAVASGSTQVIPKLLQRLDKDHRVRERAAEALRGMGQAVANYPEVIPALFRLLDDENDRVRERAAEALGEMGPSAANYAGAISAWLRLVEDGVFFGSGKDHRSAASKAIGQAAANHPEIIPALLRLLANEDDPVRATRVEALGEMGQAVIRRLEGRGFWVREKAAAALKAMGQATANHPGVIPALLRLLEDEDPSVRSEATEALRVIGQTATNHPAVIPALFRRLEDRYYYLRWYHTGGALGAMGEDVIPALLLRLESRGYWVRERAAEALRGMGQAAANHPGVIPALLRLLDDEHDLVRRQAAETLGEMGQAAANHPGVIPALLHLLQDKSRDSEVGSTAAKALGAMGQAAANHPGAIPTLLRLLKDEDVRVCQRAAITLGEMGPLAVNHPEVIPAVLASLRVDNARVRCFAAYALGKMGQAVASHLGVIPALLACLGDNNSDVRSSATAVLQNMGSAAATRPEVVSAWVRKLEDKNHNVRSGAAVALQNMGSAAASHAEVIPALLRRLMDNDRRVRSSAAAALENMGVRVFEIAHPYYPWKFVAQLSAL